MKILMDNVEKIVKVSEYESFQYLLWDIEKSVETKGRIITSLKVDGLNLDSLSDFSLEEISVVEVMSQSPLMLLKETIVELNDYIDKFFYGIEDIVYSFRNGDKVKGIDNLVEGIYGLEWIFQILKNSERLLYLRDFRLLDIYEKADTVMIELTEAIDNKDYHRISVLMEFPLYNVLSNIKEFIPILFEKTEVLTGVEVFIN
ncbi:MAG: hypothetical protein KA277_08215 [Fusobacteriaceae bacterium]|nr:hypothetical protein [Fusobacteriaceae bacterium]MBP6467991.1 hypothetical protein [Fusobacteriaceae bacterium]